MSARSDRLNLVANVAIGGGIGIAALSGVVFWLLRRIDMAVEW